jgi:polyhydroxyalkanoate synthesis regulator protein
MEMFQNAMRMFTAFPQDTPAAPAAPDKEKKDVSDKADDLQELKEQVAAMQRKIDSMG